jgi:cytidyltransferase-like protein
VINAMRSRIFGSIIGLRPEWVERYKVLHEHVFPGVLDRLTRSNIRNYSIFLGLARDDADAGPAGPALTLFSHLEYTGVDHAGDMAEIAADETTKQWWTLTDPMQVPLPERAGGDWWVALPEWHAIESGESGGSADLAARRMAFAFAGPSDLTSDPRARFAAQVAEFQASIRTLRAFTARQHIYVYLEAAPTFAPDAFAGAIDRALGGGTSPTPLVEVFHMNGAPAPRKTVFVSGCFDMLHSGHVAFLQEAAGFGDLHVGIGSDRTVFEIKGRYTVNSEAERRYMIEALACVKACSVNSGRGMLDFEDDLQRMRPDVLVTNEDGHTPAKEALCRSLGIEYRVLRRVPHAGLPARSTTALRAESTIPYRIDLAGGWLDQPFVSKLHPGPVLTVSIEPTVEFNDRSGMASSTRRRAVELWGSQMPHGDPETLARVLFGFENPPGKGEIAGSQDALGIVLPGLNRLDYAGDYWPARISRLQDEFVLGWLEEHLSLVALGPRPSEFSVTDETRIDAARARALAAAASDCWEAIRACDLRAFGDAVRRSFHAQVAMFPRMMSDHIRAAIDRYRDVALGWKLSGAGGGGYLILVVDAPVETAMRIKIRRKSGD